jgi:predicted transcriptional regulator
MENNRFIVVAGWMMTSLGLSGNDLLCYALIHGYSQDGQGVYFGSISHTAEALNISRRAAADVLNRLVERGVVTRKHVVMDGVQRCMYKAVVPDEAKAPPSSPPSGRSRRGSEFQRPTVEEVKEYCRQRGNDVDAERFVDFYEANGWVQGRGKRIKDWKAAVRTWEKGSNKTGNNGKQDKERILAGRQGELAREIAELDAGYRARHTGTVGAVGIHDGS